MTETAVSVGNRTQHLEGGDSLTAKAGYQPLHSCLGSRTTFGQGNFFLLLLGEVTRAGWPSPSKEALEDVEHGGAQRPGRQQGRAKAQLVCWGAAAGGRHSAELGHPSQTWGRANAPSSPLESEDFCLFVSVFLFLCGSLGFGFSPF